MNNINTIKDIVLRFGDILSEHSRHMECFCDYGVQLEGWFKGELLKFLDELKTTRQIANFDREVLSGSGKRKVDFRIEIGTDISSELMWVELKHWLIGYQKGYKYNCLFYFSDASSIGIKPDVEKLIEIKQGNKFILALATANPGDEWLTGVSRFNKKFSPLFLTPITMPERFPAAYFLGLLEVARRA